MLVACQVLLLLLPLAGCWDYREVENLQIVAGMAIDKGQNGYKYHTTFECVKLSGGGGQGGGGPQPVILETDGNTIFDTVRSALGESDKKLYFSHCKIVVISQDIASGGLKSFLDWFLRDAEPRATLDFLVSKEPTAGEILRVKPKTADITSFQISESLHGTQSGSGKSLDMELYQVNNIINSEGTALVLPAVEKKEEPSGPSVQIAGGALFDDDNRLQGWLDGDQMKYLNFIKNKIGNVLLLTGEKTTDQNIALEILSSKTKVQPIIKNGTPSVKIQISLEASLGEQDSTVDMLKKYGDQKIQKFAENTLETNLKHEITMVQQQYGSDIFGFGTEFEQDKPKEWDKMKANWNSLFPKLKCDVTADVIIRNAATGADKGGGK